MSAKVRILLLGSVTLAAFALIVLWQRRGANDPTFFSVQKPLVALTPGQPIPDFNLPLLGGGEFSLSSVGNKVVLVNFWASWCDPCAREFPSLLKLVKQFDGQVELVAISVDANKRDVEKFLKAFDGDRPHLFVLWDPTTQVAARFGTEQYPETYIFNKAHGLMRKVTGLEDWTRPELVRYLRSLTEGAPQL